MILYYISYIATINISPTNDAVDGAWGFSLYAYSCLLLKPSHVSFTLMCLLLEKVITTSIPVKILAGWHCQGSVTACMMCVWAVNSFHGSTTSNLPILAIRSLSWLLLSHTYILILTWWIRKPFLTSFTASSKAFFTAEPSHLLIFTGLSLSWKNDSNILSTDDTHIKITVSRNVTPCNTRAHWFTTTSFSSIRTSLKH